MKNIITGPNIVTTLSMRWVRRDFALKRIEICYRLVRAVAEPFTPISREDVQFFLSPDEAHEFRHWDHGDHHSEYTINAAHHFAELHAQRHHNFTEYTDNTLELLKQEAESAPEGTKVWRDHLPEDVAQGVRRLHEGKEYMCLVKHLTHEDFEPGKCGHWMALGEKPGFLARFKGMFS